MQCIGEMLPGPTQQNTGESLTKPLFPSSNRGEYITIDGMLHIIKTYLDTLSVYSVLHTMLGVGDFIIVSKKVEPTWPHCDPCLTGEGTECQRNSAS